MEGAFGGPGTVGTIREDNSTPMLRICIESQIYCKRKQITVIMGVHGHVAIACMML